MARTDELRLIAKVAALYYERGVRQADIAAQLDISQATVSRLLKRALDEQIVRVTVSVPTGVYTELEADVQARYGLKEVIVVESAADETLLQRNLGAAAALYVETTLKAGDVVGISSWSATLLAMVDAMHPLPRTVHADVVQILGGVGNPAAEGHAAHLTRRMAALTHGNALFLPAPGVTGAADTTLVWLADAFVQSALARFRSVTLALVGIGAVEPSRLLADSGNVFAAHELAALQQSGAVGDICLRYYDAQGVPLHSELQGRVIGMELPALHQVQRAVGIAGGLRKVPAIRGALVGGHINVLITDRAVAAALVAAD